MTSHALRGAGFMFTNYEGQADYACTCVSDVYYRQNRSWRVLANKNHPAYKAMKLFNYAGGDPENYSEKASRSELIQFLKRHIKECERIAHYLEKNHKKAGIDG